MALNFSPSCLHCVLAGTGKQLSLAPIAAAVPQWPKVVGLPQEPKFQVPLLSSTYVGTHPNQSLLQTQPLPPGSLT